MPAVQERLMSLAGADLGKSLNTDEAAVMGAVYKAADLSAGFKVKKFLTKDGVLFPIQVCFVLVCCCCFSAVELSKFNIFKTSVNNTIVLYLNIYFCLSVKWFI